MATKPRQRKKANVAKQKRGNVRTGKLADRSLLVHIRLRFLEPGVQRPPGSAKQWRAFPEGMECCVRWGKPVAPVRKGPSVDNSWEASDKDSLARQKCRIARDGQLQFQMSTGDAVKAEWFTVEFEHTETLFFVAEKQGSPRQLALKARSDAFKAVEQQEARICSLPDKWALIQADAKWKNPDEAWRSKAQPEYIPCGKVPLLIDNAPRPIGTAEQAKSIFIDPHWQYLRFEFFDRYYGHGPEHDNQPVLMPRRPMLGYRTAPSPDNKFSQWEIHCDWPYQPQGEGPPDPQKLVYCLPWWIQNKDDGQPEPKPDDKSQVKFLNLPNSYVESTSATERKIIVLDPKKPAEAERLKPGANRLKLYDLPILWKSRHYHCRLAEWKAQAVDSTIPPTLPACADVFEKMATRPTACDRPLTFSLDDMVLIEVQADQKHAPLTVPATHRPSVFYHEFLDPETVPDKAGRGGRKGAKYSRQGLYQPGPDRKGMIERAVRKEAEQEKREALITEYRTQLRTRQQQKETSAGNDLGNSDVQKRIDAAGQKAEQNVADDGDAQLQIKQAGDTAVTGIATLAPGRVLDAKNAAIQAEKDAIGTPFSDVELRGTKRNYIADYPHWSRLVVVGGNLFDVFDQRTEQNVLEPDQADRVVGARAAVRWVDAVAAAAPGVGKPAGAKHDARPAKPLPDPAVPFYAAQPYYENFFFARNYSRAAGAYDEWGTPLAANDTKLSQGGRFDVAHLRCCDYKSNDEVAVALQYFRFTFDFTAEKSLLDDATVPEAERADKRYAWGRTFAEACATRWSGDEKDEDVDPANTAHKHAERVWVIPKEGDPKVRSAVLTYVQLTDQTHAHMAIKTIAETGTSSMNTESGTGVLRVKAGADTSARGFAGAHETGHCGTQPDEYCDREDGQFGFGSNDIPGTPFYLDEDAMMKGNSALRARYYWLLAEWIRTIPALKDKKYKIEHGTEDYELPHYQHDRKGRHYVYWPVKAKIRHKPSNPTLYDGYLYMLGKDRYRTSILPAWAKGAGEIDGILVVMLKLEFNFKGYTKAMSASGKVKTRTSDSDGTLRIWNSGLAGSDEIEITWSGGSRKKVKVGGVAGADVTVSGGEGSALPAVNTAVTAKLDPEFLRKALYKAFKDKIDNALNINQKVFANFTIPGVDHTFNKCLLYFTPRFSGYVQHKHGDGTAVDPDEHILFTVKAPDNIAIADAPDIPPGPTAPQQYWYQSGVNVVGAGGAAAAASVRDLQAEVAAGRILPHTQVHDGTNWVDAHAFGPLATALDRYWEGSTGNWRGPLTLQEMYDRAEAGTFDPDTPILGPGSTAQRKAIDLAELHPVLKRWGYSTGGAFNVWHREIDLHGLCESDTIKLTTQVAATPAPSAAQRKDIAELESKFYGGDDPRQYDFRFPPRPGSRAQLGSVYKRFAAEAFQKVLLTLDLHHESSNAKYYKTADNYKPIVNAIVGSDVNPTITRTEP